MKNLINNLLICFFLISISGCNQFKKQVDNIKPTAKLTNTRLTNINFDKVDLVFDLAVENKSQVSIKLAGLDYDFKIDKQSLISGVTAQAIKVAARSTSTIQLPVTLKFADLKKLQGEIWKQDNFNYQLDTVFNVDLPLIGKYPVPVSKKGTLPVPKIPKLKIKNVKIKKFNLTSAELVTQVEVNNPNNFDLGMSKFNYQLDINQKKWGQGNISQKSTIAKKGTGTINIPVKLDLMSIGKSTYNLLLNKSDLSYKLSGDVTLDTGIELLRDFKIPLDVKGKTSLK